MDLDVSGEVRQVKRPDLPAAARDVDQEPLAHEPAKDLTDGRAADPAFPGGRLFAKIGVVASQAGADRFFAENPFQLGRRARNSSRGRLRWSMLPPHPRVRREIKATIAPPRNETRRGKAAERLTDRSDADAVVTRESVEGQVGRPCLPVPNPLGEVLFDVFADRGGHGQAPGAEEAHC